MLRVLQMFFYVSYHGFLKFLRMNRVLQREEKKYERLKNQRRKQVPNDMKFSCDTTIPVSIECKLYSRRHRYGDPAVDCHLGED